MFLVAMLHSFYLRVRRECFDSPSPSRVMPETSAMKLDLPTKDLRGLAYPLLMPPRYKRKALSDTDPFHDSLKRITTDFIHLRNLARVSRPWRTDADDTQTSSEANKTMTCDDAATAAVRQTKPTRLLGLSAVPKLSSHTRPLAASLPQKVALRSISAPKLAPLPQELPEPEVINPQITSPTSEREGPDDKHAMAVDVPKLTVPTPLPPVATTHSASVTATATFRTLPAATESMVVPESKADPGPLSVPQMASGVAPLELKLKLPQPEPSHTTTVTKRVALTRREADDDDYELIPLEVLEDMLRLEETFPVLSTSYRLLDKIGEGTFSTVYKAEAIGASYGWGNDVWKTPVGRHRLVPGRNTRKNPIVALKQIYVTLSPVRIHNELNLLYILLGNKHVAPLLDILRHQDQVVVILPYYAHADFRDFYRDLPIKGIKKYLWEMFSALEFVHLKNVIHRDLKPTNFLYDPFKGRGVLVDFGLAEKYVAVKLLCVCAQGTGTGALLARRHKQVKPAYPKQDQRPPRRANRAGTRGFRAPEVLFKCLNQTTKIDIWLAGIIGMLLLARKFPLFNSPDDTDALVEMALIFGTDRLQRGAELHGCGFQMSLAKTNALAGNLPNILHDFLQHEVDEGCFPADSVVYDTLRLFNERGDKLVRPADDADADNYEDHKHLLQLLGHCFHMDPAKRATAKELKRLPFFDELTKVDDDIIYE